MVTNKHTKKSAFTMIELIFAIVIIGISVLALPAMIGATKKGIENNIVQEAIFAASAELMGASAGYWDERSMDDISFSHLSRVIDLNGNCNSDLNNDRYRLKPGHIHRRCLDDNSTTGLDLNTNANVTSLDDAKYTNQRLFTDYTTEAAGYKTQYDATLDVSRNGNIKTITINVFERGSIDVITSLKMQSANIGEIEFYKRTM